MPGRPPGTIYPACAGREVPFTGQTPLLPGQEKQCRAAAHAPVVVVVYHCISTPRVRVECRCFFRCMPSFVACSGRLGFSSHLFCTAAPCLHLRDPVNARLMKYYHRADVRTHYEAVLYGLTPTQYPCSSSKLSMRGEHVLSCEW